jgi:hypothetical protein
MSNRIMPPQEVIDYFEALGLKYKVVTDSIYTDKRDSPVHYFQSDDADGFKFCSTILAEDAIKLFKNVSEPFSKKVEKSFGERCPNGHLRSLQPCHQCKKPDGRSSRAKKLTASHKEARDE